MKLYKYTSGLDEKFGVAADEQDAYERREEVDATFHFLPARIEEVIIPGYVITITKAAGGDQFDAMDLTKLREWLDANGVEYASQAREAKLRDMARASLRDK